MGLYSNQLTGAIPAELGQLTHLTKLGLHSNQLMGAIPRELGQLTKLKELRLGDDQLERPPGCPDGAMNYDSTEQVAVFLRFLG